MTHPSDSGAAGGSGPQRVRTSAHLTVRWELPVGVVHGGTTQLGRDPVNGGRECGGGNKRLVVGLFRLGVGSNTAGIISKRLFDQPPEPCRHPHKMIVGTVPFYAPKSVSASVTPCGGLLRHRLSASLVAVTAHV